MKFYQTFIVSIKNFVGEVWLMFDKTYRTYKRSLLQVLQNVVDLLSRYELSTDGI